MINILVYILIGLMTLSALVTVASIGKSRNPITHGDAIFSVLINGVFIVLLILSIQ